MPSPFLGPQSIRGSIYLVSRLLQAPIVAKVAEWLVFATLPALKPWEVVCLAGRKCGEWKHAKTPSVAVIILSLNVGWINLDGRRVDEPLSIFRAHSGPHPHPSWQPSKGKQISSPGNNGMHSLTGSLCAARAFRQRR